jgi:hypothetical protein
MVFVTPLVMIDRVARYAAPFCRFNFVGVSRVSKPWTMEDTTTERVLISLNTGRSIHIGLHQDARAKIGASSSSWSFRSSKSLGSLQEEFFVLRGRIAGFFLGPSQPENVGIHTLPTYLQVLLIASKGIDLHLGKKSYLWPQRPWSVAKKERYVDVCLC